MKHLSHCVAGTGERVQYLVHDFNDNTIRFILHYPGIPDSAVLRMAIKKVIESVDVLHSSFRVGAVLAYWDENGEYEERDYFRIVETQEDLMTVAYEEAVQPILPEDKVQMKCSLVVSSGMTESALVVCISHLCADGGDGKYLLMKLTEAYRMIVLQGSAERLCVKNGSRKAEQVYEQISKKEYMSLMHNPIPGIKSVFPFPTEETGNARIIKEIIPSEIMRAAKEKATRAGATVNDVLLTACYHAYASIPDIGIDTPMSIMSMMDLRKHCKAGDSEGICNITGSLPTILPDGLQDSFAGTLVHIAMQTKKLKDDRLAGLSGMPLLHNVVKVFPMGVLRLAAKHVYGSMAVGLTNLGQLSSEEFALDNLKLDEAIFGGPSKKKPGMQVSIISLDDVCVLSITGEYTDDDAKELWVLLEQMKKEIEKYAGKVCREEISDARER